MSGRKNYYVTAREVEKELSNQRQRQNREMNEMLKKLDREMSIELTKVQERMGKTENKITEKYNNLHRDFVEAEKRHQKNVNELSARIESTRSELKQYVDASVGEIRRDMNHKAESEKKSAEDFLVALDYSYSEMKRLQCHLYMPDIFKKYGEIIEQVKKNIHDSHFQAALATAQQYYIEGFGIRQELEMLNAEVISNDICIKQKINKLDDLICNSKYESIEYKTSDNKKEKITVDLSYWAEKSWKELENNKNELVKKYHDTKQIGGENCLQTLQDINAQSEKLIVAFFELKTEALSNHVAMTATMDRQEEIADSLKNLGFLIIDNFFEDEDERKSNVLLLENAGGEKILIRVAPDKEKQDIHVSFSTLNNVTHASRMKALNDIVGKEPREVEGFENKAAPDVDFDVRKYGRKKALL